ncbi:MAG: DUF29 domain-containing protein [Thiohalocapsa sp.]|jgi:hypothetical protein|uniref:DUF29 domain-containing protein n=1 Tax=Thiohalocapsa sp. TaxID=2497641 RepID=UPI0025F4AA10|nr:DUF29 domain-containing protein [Thiohalocapsa sp.]MCG6941593.1 DUF29 domain-containing protein [Thiohalocapsa sp.]
MSRTSAHPRSGQPPPNTRYEDDIAAWADEQAALLRAGRLDEIDIANIAEEIEDVGRSERRELDHRMALLIAHLLKWQFQPERRGASWQLTIRNQRRGLHRHLQQTPSLRPRLADPDWLQAVWDDGVASAAGETGLAGFPEQCPWRIDEVLREDWLP